MESTAESQTPREQIITRLLEMVTVPQCEKGAGGDFMSSSINLDVQSDDQVVISVNEEVVIEESVSFLPSMSPVEVPTSQGLSSTPGEVLPNTVPSDKYAELSEDDEDEEAPRLAPEQQEATIQSNTSTDHSDKEQTGEKPQFVEDHCYFTPTSPEAPQQLSTSEPPIAAPEVSSCAGPSEPTPSVQIMRTGFAMNSSTDLKLIEGENGSCYYLKIVDTPEEVEQILESIQRQFSIVLQVKRTDKNYGASDWKPRRFRRKDRSLEQGYGNVYWASEATSGKEMTPAIKYDGMPYMNVATRVFQCVGSSVDGTHNTFTIMRKRRLKGPRSKQKKTDMESLSAVTELLNSGKPAEVKSKTKSRLRKLKPKVLEGEMEAMAVDVNQVEVIGHDTGHDPSQVEVELEADDNWQHQHCLYKIGVKQVIKFPKFSVNSEEPPSGRNKNLIRKLILKSIESNCIKDLAGEMKYYVKIPLPSHHQNHQVSSPAPVHTSQKYHQWLLSRLYEHTKMSSFDPPMSHIQLHLEQREEKVRIHSLVMSSASSVLQYAIENNNLCNTLADILTPLDAVTLEVFIRFLYCGQLVVKDGCSYKALEKAFNDAKLSEGKRLLDEHIQSVQGDWVETLSREWAGFSRSVSTQTTLDDFCLMAESPEEVNKSVDTSGIESLGDLTQSIDLKLKPEDGVGYVIQVQRALEILFPKHATFQDYQIIKKWTIAGFSLGEIVRQVLSRRLRKIDLMQEMFSWYPQGVCKACMEGCQSKGHFVNSDSCASDISRTGHKANEEFIQSILETSANDQEEAAVLDYLQQDGEDVETGEAADKVNDYLKTTNGEIIHLNKSQSKALKTIMKSKNQDQTKQYQVSVPVSSDSVTTPQVKKLKVVLPKNSSKKDLYNLVSNYLSSPKDGTPAISPVVKPTRKRKSTIDDPVIVFKDPDTGKKVTKRPFAGETATTPTFTVRREKNRQKSANAEKNPFVVRVGAPVKTPGEGTVRKTPIKSQRTVMTPKRTGAQGKPRFLHRAPPVANPSPPSVICATNEQPGTSTSPQTLIGNEMNTQDLRATMTASEYDDFEASLMSAMQDQNFDPGKPVVVYVNSDPGNTAFSVT